MRFLLGVLLGVFLMGNTVLAADAGYGAKGAINSTQPTVEEMLQFAIQDEYLAKAQYSLVMDTFGELRPFSNIVQSEAQHIALLRPLFTDRGWNVPEDESRPHLVTPQNFTEALKLAEQAEVDNIAMYEHFLNQKNIPDDLKSVFERLLAASRRHLNAFRR